MYICGEWGKLGSRMQVQSSDETFRSQNSAATNVHLIANRPGTVVFVEFQAFECIGGEDFCSKQVELVNEKRVREIYHPRTFRIAMGQQLYLVLIAQLLQ